MSVTSTAPSTAAIAFSGLVGFFLGLGGLGSLGSNLATAPTLLAALPPSGDGPPLPARGERLLAVEAAGAGVELWWALAGWKVSRTQPTPEASGEAVLIAAARNEVEAAQLVVRSPVELRGVRVKVEDLEGEGGARLPASVVEVLRVGYVHIARPTDATGLPGPWPDPLPPIRGPLTLEAGVQHPFWVRVTVPRDAPVGDYTGRLRLGFTPGEPGAPERHVEVPLRVHVWDFTLPDRMTCTTAFGFSPHNVWRYHRLEGEAERRAVLEKYLSSFSAHHISPYDPAPLDPPGVTWPAREALAEATPDALVSLPSLAPTIDWNAWDAAMTRAIDTHHFNSFRLHIPGLGGGTFHARTDPELLGFGEKTPQYRALLASYCRQVEAHLRERGWLDEAYLYWFDEPAPRDYEFVMNGFRKLREAAPGIQRMLTEEVQDALVGGPDIWCPISNAYDAERAGPRRAQGERFWWYVCTGPKAPFATLFIDHPATELRVWLWQTWQRRLDGILVWQTNYWTSDTAYPDPAAPQNPYDDPMGWQTGYGTPKGERHAWGNGDGRFIYPPEGAATGRQEMSILEGPVDSIRWEMLRDGIEDYEYLAILGRLLARGGDALDDATRAAGTRLLEVPGEITRSMTEFTADPTPIESRRAEVARAIEATERRLALQARARGPGTIWSPVEATPLEQLAARELRRYLLLRTGEAPAIEPLAGRGGDGHGHGDKDVGGDTLAAASGFLVARADRLAVLALAADAAAIPPQGYLLRALERPGRRLVLVTGQGDAATLVASYRLAERLGVRFALHGDSLPDDPLDMALPLLDGLEERGRPLFERRGIQPFHDFPEGPDWWDRDDWLAVIAQLPKLGMNFLGLHTYPEGGPNAEPTVWIGPPEEVGEDGHVRAAYPASWQNTLRGNWGYDAKPTSAFANGASELFEEDAYGADVQRGLCPRPSTPEEEVQLFERSASLLREAFTLARQLGVETCVGTETPLTVPRRVRERLREEGRDPDDPATLRALYRGIFQRAAAAYPIDWFWLWTPEGWTWQGASIDDVRRTVADLHVALGALHDVGAPFRLATCGWVLGPQGDRALFDSVLPATVPVSCINQQVGNAPIDPAFSRVKGREKWAIPWLEDDPGLTAPQLWAGRMRRDGADALAAGCSGLLGIHWRTRILAPNVLALSRAAWSQEGWRRIGASGPGGSSTGGEPSGAPRRDGPVGGKVASFSAPIDGTEEDAIYQTVRYDMAAYHLEAPSGRCRVTLRFSEPHHTEPGQRVFGVRIEGEEVIAALDIVASAGRNRALDLSFDDVDTRDGWLDLEFIPKVEHPLIAGIDIAALGPIDSGAVGAEGAGLERAGRGRRSRRINCGGPGLGDVEADPEPTTAAPSFPPSGDLYLDWAFCEFGPAIGAEAAAIFERLDGRLPRPADWVDGPGGIKPDPRGWDDVQTEYAFVDELAALAPRVTGAGERERLEFWLEQLGAVRSMAQIRCLWAEYDSAVERAKKLDDDGARRQTAREAALPARHRLVVAVAEAYGHLLASVRTKGDLGTIANWDQHILPRLLEKPGRELEALLGEPLPAAALPSREYSGPPRLIVPTVRTAAVEGETLEIEAIVLEPQAHEGASPARVELRWHPLGGEDGAEEVVSFEHVARGVHHAVFPAGGMPASGLEYHIAVETASGMSLRFPATSPRRGQTVVAMPRR